MTSPLNESENKNHTIVLLLKMETSNMKVESNILKKMERFMIGGGYPLIQNEISGETIHQIEKSFHTFDRNGKGYLDRLELKMAIYSIIGVKPIKVLVKIINLSKKDIDRIR